MQDADFRQLVRRETEILNAPYVLNAGKVQIPRPEDLSLPGGLEFVDLVRCKQLFQEVLKQSEGWSRLEATSEAVEAAGYADLFAEAAGLFLSAI